MKKIAILFLCSLFLSFSVFAQDEAAEEAKIWTTGGQIQVNLNQLALANWAAGGENNIAGILLSGGFANYKKGKHAWDNKLDLTYGTVWTKANGNRKSDDRIELSSKYGYQLADKWYASTLLNLRTQLFEGYNFFDDGTKDLVSKLFAPAYLAIGIGAEYKPSDIFSLYLSPATGKFTFVSADADINEVDYGLEEGETIRSEFGAFINALYKQEIATNVELTSQLQLFNAYEANTDIDWQTGLNLKVNKYITATLLMHLIYDHDVKIGLVDDDGNAIMIDDPDNPGTMIQQRGRRTQFKEAFGVGFSYKF